MLHPPPLVREFARLGQECFIPKRAFRWMLQHAAELADLLQGEESQLLLVGAWLCKLPQPPPGPARRVRHNRAASRPGSGVPLGVPGIHAGHVLVDAVGADEQCRDLPHHFAALHVLQRHTLPAPLSVITYAPLALCRERWQ
ncbi:hypothetical protein AWB61_02945 [Chromobacterium sp. F49]|nr:hypothetical protein Cv017_01390 [Chromobacterium subtsugae]KZE84952.1 hypothetical protein AWB61_02945 [Chromobacterium sp. F49]